MQKIEKPIQNSQIWNWGEAFVILVEINIFADFGVFLENQYLY